MTNLKATLPLALDTPVGRIVVNHRLRECEGRWMLLIDDRGPIVHGTGIADEAACVEHVNQFFHRSLRVAITGEAREELDSNAALASVFWAAVECGAPAPVAFAVAKRSLSNFNDNGVVILL